MEQMTQKDINWRLLHAGIIGPERDELARIFTTGPQSPHDDQLLAAFNARERAIVRRYQEATEDMRASIGCALVALFGTGGVVLMYWLVDVLPGAR